MRWLATTAFVTLSLAYPILVFVGLRFLEPRVLALILAAILGLRLLTGRGSVDHRALGRALVVPGIGIALVYGLVLILNEGAMLLYVPALISLALLVSFARSLYRPPPIIEVFARLSVSFLSAEEVRYCRHVTVAWCLFFASNAALSLWLAVFGSMGAWTLYNGLIAYVVVGLLFAGEYVYRNWRFRRFDDGAPGRLLQRLFGPRIGRL